MAGQSSTKFGTNHGPNTYGLYNKFQHPR